MNKYNFGEYDSKYKLSSLVNNFEAFKLDETNISKALNLCSDAWHLTDFVFTEFKDELQLENLGDFRATLYGQCEYLKIMHDLANASKHSELKRPKAEIKLTQKHNGAFSSAFSRDFDTSHLEIILEDDVKLDFLKIIEDVIIFWKNYFETTIR